MSLHDSVQWLPDLTPEELLGVTLAMYVSLIVALADVVILLRRVTNHYRQVQLAIATAIAILGENEEQLGNVNAADALKFVLPHLRQKESQ